LVTTTASTPAIAQLKGGDPLFSCAQVGSLPRLLQSALADKGIDPAALDYLSAPPYDADFLPRLLGLLVMRLAHPELHFPVLADSIRQVRTRRVHAPYTYSGTEQENAVIDSALAESSDRGGYRARIGRGAARSFSLGALALPHLDRAIRRVLIVILGAGAAGTLAARTLVNASFENILVLDQTGGYGGLWKQPNVKEGLTNNPFSFDYEDLLVGAAPLPGDHITTFLEDLATPPNFLGWRPLPAVVKAKVMGVEPGELAHRVTYRDEAGEHSLIAPIVVNTLGIGKPLPPSRPGVMETDVPHLAGIRWQQVWSTEQAHKLRGKNLAFIGLGNSTAEMLVQLQEFNARGYGINYRVLTHYPQEALDYPRSPIPWRGGTYRLYRDTTISGLTRLAGDLRRIDRAFVQVRESSAPERAEVLSEVAFWTLRQGPGGAKSMTVRHADGSTRSFPIDQLFSLIGYGHRSDELKALGLVVTDDYLGAVAADLDGEVQRTREALGRSRLHAGYSLLGSMLKSRTNQNAQVIPGLLYRLPDWLATVIWRAAEYVAGNQGVTL